MNLNGTASSLLVIWYFTGSLLSIVALIGFTMVIYRLNRRLESLERQIEPSLRRSEELLATANERLTAVGAVAENILVRGESISESLQERTESTTGLVQRAVYLPFVHANALLAGISSAVSTLASGRSHREKAKN